MKSIYGAILILALATALSGVVLTGCSQEPEPRVPLMAQRVWSEGAYERVRLVKPIGATRQCAEAWLQARGDEGDLRKSLGGKVVVLPANPKKLGRHIQPMVHYPDNGQEIAIVYIHLMRGKDEIDFLDRR